MNPNVLWIAWVAMFVILETLGLLGIAGMNPLTHYIRLWLPQIGALLGGAIAWFILHVYWEKPRKRKDTE